MSGDYEDEMLSESDLNSVPVAALEQMLANIPRTLTPRQSDNLGFKVEKVFRRACLAGDLERVRLFLEGLPEHLARISKSLLTDNTALSWAAHGGQAAVIEYICSRQHDSDFMGYDYDAALAVLAVLDTLRAEGSGAGVHGRVEFSDYAAASSMAVVYHVAIETKSLELIEVLEDRIASALDRQIAHQMRSQNRG